MHDLLAGDSEVVGGRPSPAMTHWVADLAGHDTLGGRDLPAMNTGHDTVDGRLSAFSAGSERRQ
jgi:hypothetical protein